MNTSAQCWYCPQCGLYLYSEDEANGHYRSTHQPGSAQPRLYGRCGDCGDWLSGIETITHHCDEAERRKREASEAGRFFLIAVAVSLAAVGLMAYVVVKVGLWLIAK